MTSANPAPDELTMLRELVSALQSALEETKKENSLLRQKIDALCRRVFGSSSEKIDAAQLELLLQMANSGGAPSDKSQIRVTKKVTTVEKECEGNGLAFRTSTAAPIAMWRCSWAGDTVHQMI